MSDLSIVKQFSEYTFKYNMSLGRHGWLRLTPAYSVHLVEKVLNLYKNKDLVVFDPFSGTGTTGVVAAKNGYNAVLNEINPFLVWFAAQKAANYSDKDRDNIRRVFLEIIEHIDYYVSKENWIPNIFKIEKWWNTETLNILSAIRASIVDVIGEPKESNRFSLIWIAFCRVIIETSSVAFNHISMTLKSEPMQYKKEYITDILKKTMANIISSTDDTIKANVNIVNGDSRILNGISGIDVVITSPPYPNRISYIRELRPYMYWLKYIINSEDSSEIDWSCIGGTWGAATSKLMTWEPEASIVFAMLEDTVNEIAGTENKNSKLMSIYVYKYFYDMYMHIKNLYKTLNEKADVYYIVGNSTFFNVNVKSDLLYEKMFDMAGYSNISSEVIRKRNCNKKLYEYCIKASKNGGTTYKNKYVYAAPNSQTLLPFG